MYILRLTHRRLNIYFKQEDNNMGLFGKKDKKSGSNLSSNSQLNIEVKKDGTEYTFLLDGRLDTITSPELESKVNEATPDATKLIMDLEKLEYISSAGLRVLLGAVQAMDGKGDMVVRNLTQSVKEVFELTGFSRLFNIE